MKKILSFIAVYIVAAVSFFTASSFPVSSEATGANLLTDGGFTQYTVGGGLKPTYTPDLWSLTGFKGKMASENLYIYNTLTENAVVKPKTQGGDDLYIDLDAGDYVATFDAYIDGEATLSVYLRTAGGAENACGSTNISDLADFTPTEIEFTLADAGSYLFELRAEVSNSGGLRLDNLGLYENSSESPNPLSAERGAYIRASGTQFGLRFVGSVNKAVFDGYADEYEDVAAGMLIVPTDYLDGCEFTYAALTAAGKCVQVCVAYNYYNADTAATDGFYGFYCALCPIMPYNIDRAFSARSFLRYTVDDGLGGKETVYIYGDYSEEDNSRSALAVAQAIYDDREAYDAYSQNVKNAVDFYLQAIENPFFDTVNNGDNSFTLSFENVRGYFALCYNGYDVNVTGFTVDGVSRDLNGVYLLADSSDVEVTVSVQTAETLAECPVTARIYKTT